MWLIADEWDWKRAGFVLCIARRLGLDGIL